MTEKDNIDRRIKRNIYGKPQSILVIFPPGLSGVASDEAQYILEHLWFQNKFTSEITVLKNALRIDKIHMFAITELLMRGQCFTDIRLIIGEDKVVNIPAFDKYCHDISWDFYLAQSMSVKLKIDTGASPALHEGAMKEILSHCVESKVKRIVKGEDAEETTAIFVDVYKYNATTSISLAGSPLYKRGYRSVLSNSAPLREDIAACCIQQALQFGVKNNEDIKIDSLLNPFSGTGTFLFEYWIARYQFSPVLFERKYAVQEMPLYRADNFNYLLKKSLEHCLIDSMNPESFYCIDNAESANKALLENVGSFKRAVEMSQLSWTGAEKTNWYLQENFLKMDLSRVIATMNGSLFVPINPPYGIRLADNQDTVTIYKKIAQQLNILSGLTKSRGDHLLGFILCPSEDAWSCFCKTLNGAAIDTYHINQGGLDIRVCQFYI